MRSFVFSVLFLVILAVEAYPQCVSGNCDNGQGTLIYSDGKYVGRWKNGLRHGEGTFISDDGTKYICYWVDDAPNGKGKIINPDGSSFTGVIKNWQPYDGYGTVIGGNYRYEGRLKNGLFQGKGSITYIEKEDESASGFADGDMYAGNFVDSQKHGQGTFYYANGDKYSGNWKMNQKHGKGTMKWSERGIEYTGQWINNQPDGKGTLTYLNGAVYTGNFKRGCFEGQGTMVWADGSKYIGEWKECKQHGNGIMYNADGTVAHNGKWEDGEIADEGNPEE